MRVYQWSGVNLATGKTIDRTDKARNEDCLITMLRQTYGCDLVITDIRKRS